MIKTASRMARERRLGAGGVVAAALCLRGLAAALTADERRGELHEITCVHARLSRDRRLR